MAMWVVSWCGCCRADACDGICRRDGGLLDRAGGFGTGGSFFDRKSHVSPSHPRYVRQGVAGVKRARGQGGSPTAGVWTRFWGRRCFAVHRRLLSLDGIVALARSRGNKAVATMDLEGPSWCDLTRILNLALLFSSLSRPRKEGYLASWTNGAGHSGTSRFGPLPPSHGTVKRPTTWVCPEKA
ncbi:hypothetical protein VDBG_07172 [Verticillium alfalfae VaMs.102]|uniref:Uncharacterized protein n=1 Tax=Verticillium alfalfae (strain VaMs.102 / ATCC MYA-4576 / FGSC 10136) TaxID=526221 RepID=C9SQD7_VERA1|nr:hypothetical protein VDBG_07172 [Verticillium alfalfae VaMs.102]EEY21062.1 hypothetical protein VDBG_07172 [Verticillium alfalfae VaMs.102]